MTRTAAALEGQRKRIQRPDGTDRAKADIIALLNHIPSGDIHHIAQDIGAPARTVQAALIELQDEGRVLMKNGWFRLSQAERRGSKASIPWTQEQFAGGQS